MSGKKIFDIGIRKVQSAWIDFVQLKPMGENLRL